MYISIENFLCYNVNNFTVILFLRGEIRMKVIDLREDILVFDIDGVLGKYDFGELGFKVLEESKWSVENMKRNMYDTVQKTSLFDAVIEYKNPMDMYV